MAEDRNDGGGSSVPPLSANRAVASSNKLMSDDPLHANRIRAIFEVMGEGVVLQDANSQILSSNLSAARLLGLTEDELVGRTSLDPRWRLVGSDGGVLPPHEQPSMLCLRSGAPVRDFVLGVDLPLGGRRWLKVSSMPIFEDGSAAPTQTVTTFSDITEITEQQALVEAALSEATQASATKQEFLANISHELRTPLHGIIATATALGRSALDSRQQELLGIILESSRSLESLLSDLLDIARLDAGRLSIRESPFVLAHEVRSAVGLMQSMAVAKGLTLRSDISPDCEARFVGDAFRVRQILVNLISNAVKFTAAGSIMVRANVTGPSAAGSFNDITLSVADTGIGIAADTVDRLFQRFEQADPSATRPYGGSGLGLAISKALSELMGGRIEVVSRPGEGSTFTLKVSLMRAADEVNNAATERGAPPGEAGLRVLLAEDHAVNRRIMEITLEPLASKVECVSDGEEALAVLLSQRFDVAILDVQMPKMDGISVAKAVRQSEATSGSPALPIVIVTAGSAEQYRDAVAKLGRAAFLSKPLRAEALYECLEELLHQQGQ